MVLFAVALAGCSGRNVQQAPVWPPPIHEETLPIEPSLAAEVKAFAAGIEASMAAGRCDEVAAPFVRRADDVRKWCESVRGKLVKPARFRYDVLYPRPPGLVARVSLRSDQMQGGGAAAFQARDPMYIGPREDGRLEVYPNRPWPGPGPRLTALVARIWIAPASEWLVADTDLEVQTDGARVLPLELWTHAPGESGRLRVAKVLQDGQPCRFQLVDDLLVVELARPSPRVNLAIRYEGEPSHSGDWVRQTDVVLRGTDARWLPLLPLTDADFDITVTRPRNFFLFGQGDEEPTVEEPAGWHRTRWRFHGKAFTLYGGPRYEVRRTRLGNLELVVAVHPESAGLIDRLIALVKRSLDDLSPLGAYPSKTLRIVETHFPGAYGAVSNITLGDGNLDPTDLDSLRDFLTHGIAHGWFGSLVPPRVDGRQAAGWSETLSEYVTSWGLSEEAATSLRKQWSDRYAAIPSENDQPILSAGWKDGWTVHSAITYSKGALVLAALEARIGRPAVQRAIATFIKKRAGKPSTWDDVVAAVEDSAGREPAAWLRSQLQRAGAPSLSLSLTGVTTPQQQRLTARLVQSTEPSQEGAVEIGILGPDGQLIQVETIPFKGPSTSITLTLPPDAQRVLLDPRYRLPRRYSATDKNQHSGLEIDLAPPRPR